MSRSERIRRFTALRATYATPAASAVGTGGHFAGGRVGIQTRLGVAVALAVPLIAGSRTRQRRQPCRESIFGLELERGPADTRLAVAPADALRRYPRAFVKRKLPARPLWCRGKPDLCISGRAAATRRRILGSALAAFSERGYSATTMDAVAADAGVAVQTVYFTFGTKSELLQAVFEHAVLGPEQTPPHLMPWWPATKARANATSTTSSYAGTATPTS